MRETQKVFTALVAFMMVLAFAVFCPQVYGQEATAKEAASKEDKWQVEIIPYFWAAGLRGDVTVKGLQSDVNVSFADLLKHVDAAGMAHAEVWKGKWGIFMDGIYMKLTASGDAIGQRVGPIGSDVKIEMTVAELGGLYRIGRWSFEDDRKLSLEALLGGRYWSLKGDVSISAPGLNFSVDNSQTKEWVDPFTGLRMNANLTRDLTFQLRGDIGGFSVGSNFSWNGSGIFGYTFTPLLTGYVGYRAMAVNYETGSGLSKFKFDATMYGPVMGVGFRF